MSDSTENPNLDKALEASAADIPSTDIPAADIPSADVASSDIPAAKTLPETPAETVAPISIGNRLRTARLGKGLTVADVANSIKFSARQVEALENDDLAHLPERAFVRGFVRSYARLLQIDASELLDTLPATHQKLADVPVDLAEVKSSSLLSNRHSGQLWLLLGVGVLLVLAVSIWLLRPITPPVPQPVTQELTLPEVVLSSAVASSVASAVSSAVPAATSAVAASAVPVVIAPPAVTVPSSGAIHLVFGVDSWTEVKDKNGVTLYQKIASANTEQWISGQAPFSLIIGNATGVHLYYKGEEVDLDEYTDISVAHLILE